MQLRACYFGTYRQNYARNRIMIEALRRNGVDVEVCHETLWQGIEDRVWVASGNFWRPSFLWRVTKAYLRLIRAYFRLKSYDVLIVGYPGHLDVWLARLLSWLSGRPLVMDVFMSPYLIANERGIVQRHPFTGRLLYWFEWLAYRLPDMLIQDTPEYVAWFGDHFGLDPERFRLVPTGADSRVFQPCDGGVGYEPCRVVYYGTFIPNHGVRHIMDAALRLRNEPAVHFELIGEGPELAEAKAFADHHRLTNVTFTGWLEPLELVERLHQATICLGVFGVTPQSLMTVQNKIYECLAAGKAVVTGESRAVARVFTHAHHLYLVERGSGEAVAGAILTMCRAPELVELLAKQGHEYFLEHFTLEQLGKRYCDHLCEVAERI